MTALANTNLLLFSPTQLKKIDPVLDMVNEPKLPENFRASKDLPLNKTPLNWQGFEKLYIAGGGQFSKLSLATILEHLKTKQLTVINLRQESHGFINDNAMCWYGFRGWENANKTEQIIEADQASRIKALSKLHSACIHQIMSKSPDRSKLQTLETKYRIENVLNEDQVVKSLSLSYFRVYVQNHYAPFNDQVDRFITIGKNLPKDQWIYFHCRAGRGRTTTFMCMYDMLQNAKDVSFEDILARQAAIGGKNLMQFPKIDNYKYELAVQRLEFLHSFYDYAHQNEDHFTTSWTAWLKEKENRVIPTSRGI